MTDVNDAPLPDDFNGQPHVAEISVTLPDAAQTENQGLTEASLPQPPFVVPADDARAQQVVGAINRMQGEHAARTGEQPVYIPGHVDMVAYARAQARYIREETLFWMNSGHQDVDDRKYIEMQNRHTQEQTIFIHAQMNLLRQLGII